MTESATRPIPIPFDAYEVHGIIEYDESGTKWCEQVADHQATFWSLFGHIPGQGVLCIGDFETRDHAEEIYARITGKNYVNGGKQ
jgi:hypothetical protein